jgi:D-aminopeptidase
VKKGLGRFSARQLPAARARELIEAAAERSLSDLAAVRPYAPGSPSEIVVDFNTSDHVERYRYRDGVEITGSRQISSRADDWWTAWRQFFF